jgi:hypothetical protein
MLIVSTWRWGNKYGPEYVERLKAGVARHLKSSYRFVVFTPDERDEDLTRIPGCLCRLRAFDPEWLAGWGIKPGDRLVTLDLDLIITGRLDSLFASQEDFIILQGANSANPCPYNGSVWSLCVGAHPEVWSDFSLPAIRGLPFYAFPDDQGWMAHKLPNAAGWQAGAASGIYAFHKPGWPAGDDLPADARIVAFPGERDPAQFTHLGWVKRHWIA